MAEERQGILDFLEPVLSGTAAFGNYYANKRSDQKKLERYKAMEGLLNQYGMGSQTASGMQSPATSAPQRGPQGLIGGGQQGNGGYLPPQFYQQAGILSGNEQFLSQDQVGGQNMQRQMQAQQNEQQYMSAAQAAQLEQSQAQYQGVSGDQQARLAQQQAQYDQGFNQISASDKESMRIQEGYNNSRLRAAEEAARNKPAFTATADIMIDPTDPTGQRAMVRPGSGLAQTQEIGRADIDRGLEIIDEAIAFAGEYGSTEYGDKGLDMTNRLRQSVTRSLQVATEAKALAEGEAARLAGEAWDFQQSFLGAPTGLLVTDMPGSGNEAKTALAALREIMGAQRDAIYRAQGVKPPEQNRSKYRAKFKWETDDTYNRKKKSYEAGLK